jgi:hypothetical protein
VCAKKQISKRENNRFTRSKQDNEKLKENSLWRDSRQVALVEVIFYHSMAFLTIFAKGSWV